MEFPFNQQEWKQILINLYKRAANDHQFHILCLRDPHAAIKLICGKELPKEFKFKFVEQQPDEIVLILPQENKLLFKELNDQDFEEIGQGMSAFCVPFAQALAIQHKPR